MTSDVRALVLFLAAALSAACSGPRTSFEAGEPVVLTGGGGVALGGYDPVSYFEGDRPVRGSKEHVAEHGGATYRFASAESREAFVADPEQFVPAYGGWCAWAVADGEGALVEVDPRSFLVQGGRLMLFYDGLLADTRKMWLARDTAELERRADGNWGRLVSVAGE
ncbi:MAG: YHS domain-containing (seleno)protein [Planctomycetota bacterium]